MPNAIVVHGLVCRNEDKRPVCVVRKVDLEIYLCILGDLYYSLLTVKYQISVRTSATTRMMQVSQNPNSPIDTKTPPTTPTTGPSRMARGKSNRYQYCKSRSSMVCLVEGKTVCVRCYYYINVSNNCER